MADERYEWLDKEAAERLLRGEPVEAADEHARAQAARLSRALYDTSRGGTQAYADEGEMPGEAAALAAFRKARADAAAPAGDTLGTVRLARPTRPAFGMRLGRPVRFGLVAAVAGCALGGVAVAAGTGLLPSPFDGPLPASTVSAAATPQPLASDSSTGGALVPPQTPGSPSTSQSPSASTGGSRSPDPTSGPEGGDFGKQGDTDKKSRERKAELRRKTMEACRDYRSGRISPERKRKLEALAKGPGRVEQFCDRLLGGESEGGKDGNDSGGSGSGDGGDGDSGDGDGGAGRLPGSVGTAGGASLPPVSWSQLPAEPAPLPSESAPRPSPSPSLAAL
ncbi:hypothetical protein AB0F96_13320 [Streptomyces sp. NPDC023998]|uniref:hypothetical protein n=1 Tax=Streptomyces sp. NPDC023998 TaxID=3154597 RepID=UPI0033F24D83